MTESTREHEPACIEAVLALGGAFNPVHTQHVALLLLARQVLEQEHNYRIRAGYLAVAPDGYVQSKLGSQAMKSTHRLAMCNLALQEHAWLVPCDRPDSSAYDCGIRRCPESEVRIVEVLGADRAMGQPSRAKWRRRTRARKITVCIGRAGESARVFEQYQSDLAAGQVVDPQAFVFVAQEVEAISSTRIRTELQRLHTATTLEARRAVVQSLVDRNYLDPLVAEYLLKQEADLYLR